MLHKFSVSGITTPAPSPVVNTNCVLNTDCASRNCTNHVCGVAVPLNVIELTNCARLDTSGATYKLMNNVFSTSPACEDMECSFCLSIIADNIILDGNGFQTESILIKDYSENYKGNENIITRDKINEVTLKNINAVTLNVYDESLGKLNIFNSNINSISLFGGRTDVIGELNADNFVTMQSPLFAIDKISLSNSNLEGIALNVGHDYSGGDGSSPNSFGYGGSISLINSQAGDLNVNGDDSYGGSGENGWNAGQVSLTNSQVGNIYANGGNSDLFGGNGGTISLDHSSASNIYANGGNGEGYNGGNGGTLSLISNLGVSLDNLISVNGGSGGNAGGNGGILFFDVPSIEYIFNITLIGGNTETNSNGGNGGSITTRGIVADIDFIDCSGGNNNPPNFDRLCIGD
jgi:hypothetical protein